MIFINPAHNGFHSTNISYTGSQRVKNTLKFKPK